MGDTKMRWPFEHEYEGNSSSSDESSPGGEDASVRRLVDPGTAFAGQSVLYPVGTNASTHNAGARVAEVLSSHAPPVALDSSSSEDNGKVSPSRAAEQRDGLVSRKVAVGALETVNVL